MACKDQSGKRISRSEFNDTISDLRFTIKRTQMRRVRKPLVCIALVFFAPLN